MGDSKIYFLITSIWLAAVLCSACSKDRVSQQGGVKYDSVGAQFSTTYLIDLNRDNINDVALQWSNIPLQQNITKYRAWPLTVAVSIHSTLQQYPICIDTMQRQSFFTTLEHNCTGGGNQIRIDTLIVTPNLDLAELSNTLVSALTDTALVYQKTTSTAIPSPGAHSIDVEYGFFGSTPRGYLLFKLDGKRFGLLVDRSIQPMQLVEVVQVDP